MAAGAARRGGAGSSACPAPPAAVEAVAAGWMLEFACSCLCRHFGEGGEAEFRRWRDVARALTNDFSEIPTHQKKTVYLCQLLIRIAKGKSLELQFENGQRISPLESALSFWTLLEREEIKLEKLHEDIRRLIQIQIVAVHMENTYFKEAAEVLERLFTDCESDKSLRMKLATIIKNKDPYVPLLQNFSYSLLISKIKSYIELFMKENGTNFLIQEATKHVESKGLGATALQNKSVNINKNDKSNLDTKQRRTLMTQLHLTDMMKDLIKKPIEIIPNEKIDVQNATNLNVLVQEQQCFINQSLQDIKNPTVRQHSGWKRTGSRVLQSLNNLENVGKQQVALACGRRRQRWTYKEDLELKSGVQKFGVGNWAKILVHGNFNNRTSVMLKDRWRTLHRIERI